MRPEALVLALVVALGSAPARAQSAPPDGGAQTGRSEMPSEGSVYSKPGLPKRLEPVDGRLVTPGDRVDANDALDEILDEVAADVARMGANRVSPILLDRIQISDNVSPEFARALEARLVAAIHRAANVVVLRCFECSAVRTEVQDGQWVVRRGLADRAALQRIAGEYGAQTVLQTSFTVYTNPSSLSLDMELVRARDASVAYAEGYRVHPHTALLYRTADKTQSREARLKDLEDRLNDKPHWSLAVNLGTIVVPTHGISDPSTGEGGPIWGAHPFARLTESFGEAREWRAGVSVGGIVNPGRMVGALLGATLLRRIGEPNVYTANCSWSVSAAFFISNEKNNSPVLGGGAECVLAHRVTAQAGLNYLFPFKVDGSDAYVIGGLSPQAGVGFQW